MTPPTYSVDIEKLVYHGWGMGTIDGIKVFVPQTVPGDRVLVRIKKKEKRFWHGVKLALESPSPFREPAACQHADDCGGCQLQGVQYETQIQFKASMIADAAFQHHLESAIPLIRPVLACDSPYFYRNKMEFAFGSENGEVILGLKRRGQFDQVVPITQCLLQDQESNAIIAFAQAFFRAAKASTWDYREHVGFLRHLMLRQSKRKAAWMVNLVVSEDNPELISQFSTALMAQFPSVASVFKSIQSAVGDTAFTTNIHHVAGDDHIIESIGSYQFKISPLSFFQTNSLQARILYDEVAKVAQKIAPKLAFDLYCGTGTIGIYMSEHCGTVIGVEENPSAIADATQNAALNSVTNIQFICDRVKNVLKSHTWTPELIVIDPPRSGMVPKAIRRILDCNAPHIVYVSCNPVTLFRDLKEFETHGYRIHYIQPVDMFPNTFHIESVVYLSKP